VRQGVKLLDLWLSLIIKPLHLHKADRKVAKFIPQVQDYSNLKEKIKKQLTGLSLPV
jgi:hypothetical protein